MSDHTLNQLSASLKTLNARLEKLGHKMEELDILAHRYKRLSYEINQIDVVAFELRQEFEHIREVIKKLSNGQLKNLTGKRYPVD